MQYGKSLDPIVQMVAVIRLKCNMVARPNCCMVAVTRPKCSMVAFARPNCNMVAVPRSKCKMVAVVP